MDPTTTVILALLGIWPSLNLRYQAEVATAKGIQEHKEYLHQEMALLLQETEGSSGTMKALLPSALQQQWLLWVSAAALVLVLLTMDCWLVKRRKPQEPPQLLTLFWPPRRHL
ncbi:unnamed protein product [Coccothraustes coccothraustes]